MVAGPWFTVHDSEDSTWQDFGRVWWSDGGQGDGSAMLQLRMRLLDEVEVAHAR